MLKPGGRLVYSTCTFNTLENEGSVQSFLARHGEFSPLEADGGLLGVARKENGEELILAANAENRERTWRLPFPCLDRIGGGREEGARTLAPLSFKIWKRCR